MMNIKLRKVGHVLLFIAVVALVIVVVMLLWNALIPSIVGWSAINFWQAAGLLLLCKLLFGGLGRHFHGGGRHAFGRYHDRDKFINIRKKMEGMSRSEKRDFIRQRMGRRFGEDEMSSSEESQI